MREQLGERDNDAMVGRGLGTMHRFNKRSGISVVDTRERYKTRLRVVNTENARASEGKMRRSTDEENIYIVKLGLRSQEPRTRGCKGELGGGEEK